MKKTLLMAGLASLIGFASFAETLTVQVTNIQGSSGTIRMALFAQENGFPDEERAIALRVIRISAGTGLAEFAGLPAGTYGIALYHDANGNEKLDTNLLGLPAEGYGFSNNARGALGPPRFRAASFPVSSQNTTHIILMRY